MEKSRVPKDSQVNWAGRFAKQDNKQGRQTRGLMKFKFFGLGFIVGCMTLALTVWLGVFSALSGMLFPQKDGPTVTTEFVIARLEAASDLTTARLIYSSVCDYSEGFVPIINKSAFSMFYSATVDAGVNVADIKPVVTDDEVKLWLPACTIRDVNIDSSSIRFFDQEHGWFSPTGEREQVREALVKASVEVKEQDMSELLNLADEQLERVMKGLLEGTIGNRKLVIEHGERAETTAKNADIRMDGKQV